MNIVRCRRWWNLQNLKSTYTSAIAKPVSSRALHLGLPWKTRKNNEQLVALTQKIYLLSQRGEIASARRMFDQMGVRDTVSWNVMIGCYLENGMIEDARELFDVMPDRTSVSWNTMIMGCLKLGKTDIALKMFVVMPEKDVVSWTVMITGLCRAARVYDAWRLFTQMPAANAVSWASIVSGFQQNGFANESLNVFRKMLLVGVQPTAHLVTSVLSACADLASVSASEQVYCQVIKRGFHGNTHIGNSAITMFVKTGSFHYAYRMFLDLNNRDRVTWNAMIMGFAQHGFGLEAIMTFHQMQKAHVLPNGISYMGVLHACSHCGFVEEGRKYFRSINTDHGISPGAGHFCAMVDLYARSGKLKEAYKFILNLPFEPTVIFWKTLLNGCRIWGYMELGVVAVEGILKLEPYNSNACRMIIDIYAMADNWKEVAKMRRYMRDTQAKKELGYSWIDVQGSNHLFTTADDVHPEADQVFPIIELLAYDTARYYSKPEGEVSCVL